VAGLVLLGFGVVSSALLVGVGLSRAWRRSYRDRSGVERTGAAAVRAGLLVAAIGAGELLVTLVLWAATR
jgi:hypothetical protein